MCIDKQKIEKWQKWTKEIIDDVTLLVEHKYLYNELSEMINKNDEINYSNLFYDFLKSNYADSMVLAICRQTDKNEKSRSLVNLLEDVFNSPESITKNWLIEKYTENCDISSDKRAIKALKETMKSRAKEFFEKNFGNGEFLDPSIIYADLGLLLHETKDIRKYRNKRVAHKDRGGKLSFNLTFTKLNNTISMIEKIAIKYNELINCYWYPEQSLMPTIVYDWKKIFKTNWIK